MNFEQNPSDTLFFPAEELRTTSGDLKVEPIQINECKVPFKYKALYK